MKHIVFVIAFVICCTTLFSQNSIVHYQGNYFLSNPQGRQFLGKKKSNLDSILQFDPGAYTLYQQSDRLAEGAISTGVIGVLSFAGGGLAYLGYRWRRSFWDKRDIPGFDLLSGEPYSYFFFFGGAGILSTAILGSISGRKFKMALKKYNGSQELMSNKGVRLSLNGTPFFMKVCLAF